VDREKGRKKVGRGGGCGKRGLVTQTTSGRSQNVTVKKWGKATDAVTLKVGMGGTGKGGGGHYQGERGGRRREKKGRVQARDSTRKSYRLKYPEGKRLRKSDGGP